MSPTPVFCERVAQFRAQRNLGRSMLHSGLAAGGSRSQCRRNASSRPLKQNPSLLSRNEMTGDQT